MSNIPALSDSRLGLPAEMVTILESEGFDFELLLMMMMKYPELFTKNDFEHFGLDFDDVLSRLKAIAPPELIAKIEAGIEKSKKE